MTKLLVKSDLGVGGVAQGLHSIRMQGIPMVPGQLPGFTDFPAIFTLPEAPSPLDAALPQPPIRKLLDITRGMGLDTTQEAAFQMALGQAPKDNPATFQTVMVQYMTDHGFPPVQRRLLLQRALNYYKGTGALRETAQLRARRARGAIPEAVPMGMDVKKGGPGSGVKGHTTPRLSVPLSDTARSAVEIYVTDPFHLDVEDDDSEDDRKDAAAAQLIHDMVKDGKLTVPAGLPHEQLHAIADRFTHASNSADGDEEYGSAPRGAAASLANLSGKVRRLTVEKGGPGSGRVKKPDTPPAQSPTPTVEKAEARGGSYHARITGEDGKHKYVYDAKQYASRPDAHLRGAEVLRDRARRELVAAVGNDGLTAESLHALALKFNPPSTITDLAQEMIEQGKLIRRDGRLMPLTPTVQKAQPATVPLLLQSGMLVVPSDAMSKAAGPFIGPHGGKWRDAAHTQHWTGDDERKQRGSNPHWRDGVLQADAMDASNAWENETNAAARAADISADVHRMVPKPVGVMALRTKGGATDSVPVAYRKGQYVVHPERGQMPSETRASASGYGAHAVAKTRRWVVAHGPSGLSVRKDMSRVEAEQLARHLDAHAPAAGKDWTLDTKPVEGDPELQAITAASRGFREGKKADERAKAEESAARHEEARATSARMEADEHSRTHLPASSIQAAQEKAKQVDAPARFKREHEKGVDFAAKIVADKGFRDKSFADVRKQLAQMAKTGGDARGVGFVTDNHQAWLPEDEARSWLTGMARAKAGVANGTDGEVARGIKQTSPFWHGVHAFGLALHNGVSGEQRAARTMDNRQRLRTEFGPTLTVPKDAD